MQKHWIWLTQRKGIGPVGCKKLLEAFQSAERIFDLTPAQLKVSGQHGVKRDWIDVLSDKDLTNAEKVVEDCDRHGIQIITYNDQYYPERLKQIYDPPCVLYCKGTMPKIDLEAAVGIVGTRRCTNFGLMQTKSMSELISRSGGLVVSGGARGIDTMALSSALSSYMPVVCVLAGGLDEYYPRENKLLFENIIRQGCLISEFPPGVSPLPQYFAGRNRLISGLSVAVLVVEAPKGSGALITAELALSQNRDVFTIQRADTGRYNSGNEELIQAGCEVVEDGWELLERYEPLFPQRLRDGRGREAMQLQCLKHMGKPVVVRSPRMETAILSEEHSERAPAIAKSNRTTQSPKAIADDLPGTEAQVLAVFGNDPLEMDEIIMRSGMEPNAVTTALTMLQIKKRIIKCFGNSYQRL